MKKQKEAKSFEMALLVRLSDAAKLLAGRGNVPTNIMIDHNIKRLMDAVKPTMDSIKDSPEGKAYAAALNPKPAKAEKKGSKKKVVALPARPASIEVPQEVKDAFMKKGLELEQTKIPFQPFTIKVERLPDSFGKERLSDFTKGLRDEVERLRAEKTEDETEQKANELNIARYSAAIQSHISTQLANMLGDVTLDGLFRWFSNTLDCVEGE